MKKYVVIPGDTLSQIARRFNTTVSAICEANPNVIKNPNDIKIGWVLLIPEKKDYNAIGQKVEKLVSKIESLPEFKELEDLL